MFFGWFSVKLSDGPLAEEKVPPHIFDKVFEQVFGQGFGQGFGEEKNHTYSVQYYSDHRTTTKNVRNL